MLTKKDKNEFREDAQSTWRRENFRKEQMIEESLRPESLDDYLQFLGQVHKVFSSMEARLRKPIGSPES